ncbi:MAG TPA: hypothetical protein VKY89_23670 [Thermoanaerobaculia bacterium]|nr:hypothetical protein [Thermoanaerobaculia bacterium]
MASPLTLLMPVLPGTTPQTIAAAMAQYGPQLDAALTSIGTVHYARTLILDPAAPNLQPGATTTSFVLGIVTEFDGSFDAYIGDFVAVVGPIFDALLQFVVGGAAVTPVAQHVAAFGAFIAQNDASQHLPNGGLFQAYTATVPEILASLPPPS